MWSEEVEIGGYRGVGGISEQSQISLGFIHILKVSLSGDVSISRCEGYLRVGGSIPPNLAIVRH